MRRGRTLTLLMAASLVGSILAAGAAHAPILPGFSGTSRNLVTNGDAETGNLTGWSATRFIASDSAPLAGSYSLAANLANWASNSWIDQTIDLSAYGPAIDAGGVKVTVDGSSSVGSPYAADGTRQCSVSIFLETQEEFIVEDGSLGSTQYTVPTGTTQLTLMLFARNIDFSLAGPNYGPVSGCAPQFDDVELLLLYLPTCDDHTATHVGTSGPDTITGTADDDVIVTFEGADEVDGGEGDDIICLGSGADTADGGPGKDVIYGEGGSDDISGGSGKDWIEGGSGDDTISGGGKRDKLFGNGGSDTIEGGSGDDKLKGGGKADTLKGGKGDDELFGGSGKDDLNGGSGTDSADGGDGTDTCDAESEVACEI